MIFQICGSGASEGIPALFCPCDICMKARLRGGKEIRTRTAYQIGESVRIDFGPDLLSHQNTFGLQLDRLEHLFMTHSHKDHFTPLNLIYRNPKYVRLEKKLCFHARERLIWEAGKILEENGSNFSECAVEPVPLEFFKSVHIASPEGELTVTPVVSDHLPKGETCIFDVECFGKRILVGTDSGIYPDETWEYFRGKHYDMAVMDATSGVLPLRHVHMGRECLVETVARMREMKLFGRDTLVITNHFSHNGGMNHDELEKYYSPYGIDVGYDGLRVELSNRGPLRYEK